MEYSQYRSIPNALKACRVARGLSQSEAARLLGHKDKTWISHWETGDALPNLVSVIRLSMLYGEPIECMFPGLYVALCERDTRVDSTNGSGTLRTP